MKAHRISGCRGLEDLVIVSKIDREHEMEHERRAVGRSLREPREQREITLEQISQASKFRVEQLKAVERGDYEA